MCYSFGVLNGSSVLKLDALVVIMVILSWDLEIIAALALVQMGQKVAANLPVAVTKILSHCRWFVSVRRATEVKYLVNTVIFLWLEI